MAKKTTATTTTQPAETPIEGQPLTLQRIRYEFVLLAEQPIAHHAEVMGNDALLMRRKIRLPDGAWANVPIITADTCRHGLREASAYAFLDAAEMLNAGSLSESALRLLFAGGMVTGGGAGAVSLDQYRELCELVPMLALLGGCAQNRVIPGRLNVEDATLICEETASFLPAWAVERAGVLDTQRAHVEETGRTRMDPMLVPEKRLLLSTSEQVRVNARLLASETASASGDAIEKAEAKSTMMPRRFERVAQGSFFFWAVEARTYTDLDRDVMNVACAAFLANAVVGGKRATGHGRMRAVAAKQGALARPRDMLADIDPTALAPKMGELFKRHVAERRDRIRSFLATVAA